MPLLPKGPPYGAVMGTGRSDREISDEELRAEIELLADVFDAVTLSTGPLTSAQIDRALGVYRSAA